MSRGPARLTNFSEDGSRPDSAQHILECSLPGPARQNLQTLRPHFKIIGPDPPTGPTARDKSSVKFRIFNLNQGNLLPFWVTIRRHRLFDSLLRHPRIWQWSLTVVHIRYGAGEEKKHFIRHIRSLYLRPVVGYFGVYFRPKLLTVLRKHRAEFSLFTQQNKTAPCFVRAG